MHVIGKPAVQVSFFVFLITLVSLIFFVPLAHADRDDSRGRDISTLKKERVCERLQLLHDRFPRLIPLPKYCKDTPPPPPDPVTVDLTALPGSITLGASTTLSWTSDEATTCTASNGWTGSKALSGSESRSPLTDTTYTLTCGNGTATSTDSVTVLVVVPPPPSPTVDVSLSPENIFEGEPSTLTWESDNATTCEASNGWTGTQAQDGNQSVNPTTTTTYTLSCGNGMSTSTDSATLTVTPIPVASVSLNVTDDSIEEGQSTTLEWSSTNTTTCDASNGWLGAKNQSGNEIVSPLVTTTYTITCGNGMSTSSDSETVTVSPPPPPAPTAEISADSETINYEESTNLNWSSTSATQCIASNGWTGAVALSGSLEITPTTSTTYTVSCGNGVSTSSDSVTVTVILPPAPTVTLGAEPDTIEEGDGTNVEWSTTNADSCIASGGWSGPKDVQGFEEVTPTVTTEYVLTCINAGGEGQGTTTVTVVPPQLDHLIISEVYYDPDVAHGADPANEWVEIHNPTSSELNLAGLFIADANSSDALPSISIPALGFAVVTASSTTASLWTFPAGVAIINIGGSIGNGLTNTGDAVYLRDSSDAVIDAMSYGSNIDVFSPAAPDVNDGHSLSRISITEDTDTAADWEDSESPTPGS